MVTTKKKKNATNLTVRNLAAQRKINESLRNKIINLDRRIKFIELSFKICISDIAELKKLCEIRD